MRKPTDRFRSRLPSTEPPTVYTDDGGSGLLDACRSRFPEPDYVVSCDARHAVWVKRADGSRSFGLSPWLLRTQSMDEVLESAANKLELTRTK